MVPYFLPEAASPRVESFLQSLDNGLAVSQWTVTDFASALGVKCRTGQIDSHHADAAMERFREVVAGYFEVFTPQEQDFVLAAEYLRHWGMGLRAGDALHLAVARNRNVECLYSLDARMVAAAREFNLTASQGI